MRVMRLQPIMNDELRVAIPKDRVSGYKHSTAYGVHIYTRGKIGYIVTPDEVEGATLEKHDYSKHEYLDVYSYDEFTKFCEIKTASKISEHTYGTSIYMKIKIGETEYEVTNYCGRNNDWSEFKTTADETPLRDIVITAFKQLY